MREDGPLFVWSNSQPREKGNRERAVLNSFDR